MSITWTKVADIPFAYPGGLTENDTYGIQGIVTLGNHRMLAVVQEFTTPTTPYEEAVYRFWRSGDDGRNWSYSHELRSMAAMAVGELTALGPDTVLMGSQTLDQTVYDARVSGLARSLDGGQTWASLASTTPNYYALIETTPVNACRVLYIDPYHATSFPNSGGVQFLAVSQPSTPLTLMQVSGDIALSAGRAGGSGAIHRSTNNGTSWSLTTPAFWLDYYFVDSTRMGSRLVIAAWSGLNPRIPHVVYSDDQGLTWSEGTILAGSYSTTCIAANGPTYAVIGNNLNQIHGTNGNPLFLLSSNGGISFTDAGNAPSGRRLIVRQIAVAEDGAFVATVAYNSAVSGEADVGVDHSEIWRGVVDGFTGPVPPQYPEDNPTWAPCRTVRAPMRPPSLALCPPPFTPVPCVQLCPPEPPLGLVLALLRRFVPRLPRAVPVPDAAPLGLFRLGSNQLGLPIVAPGPVVPPPFVDPAGQPLIPAGATFTNPPCDQACPPDPPAALMVRAAHRHRTARAVGRRH